jgi:trigger factor
VALGLLVTHIVQSQALKVDRERVLARLNALVEAYPNPDEARRAYLQNVEAMRQIESAALEDQVVDWVIERARVSERPMSFTELTGFGRSGAQAAHDREHDHEPPGAGSEQQEAKGT